MKKAFFASGALALTAGILMHPATTFAAGYGAAGCGLGSIVFGDSPGIIQVFAGTTNYTFGSQTFGITSGTSNCATGPSASLMQENFVAMNGSSLSRDAATGSGEYLSAYSVLMGCQAEGQADFFTAVKDNHDRIFTPDAKPSDVVINTRNLVTENEKLSAVCKI